MGCKPMCERIGKKYSKCKPKTYLNKKTKGRTSWKLLKNLKELGYVCNYWSSTISDLPIRRFEDVQNGSKPEPHYEDLTYGENACCNRDGRNICKQEGKKYIFFVTRYYGKLRKYRDNEYKYAITGYYVIKYSREMSGELPCCNEPLEKRKVPCKDVYKECFAVRAEDMKFTTIEGSFPLFSEKDNKPHKNLELLFGKDAKNDNGDSKDWIYKHKIENARHLRGRVGKTATEKLLKYFDNIEAKYILTKDKIKQEIRKLETIC